MKKLLTKLPELGIAIYIIIYVIDRFLIRFSDIVYILVIITIALLILTGLRFNRQSKKKNATQN